MCEPATLALLGTGASLVGAGVGAYSAISQGTAQKNSADFQAAVDKNNAVIAGYNADIAEQSQSQKTQAIERDGSLRLSAQRAALGASGVDVDTGSGGNVQSATVEDTQRAAATSQYQGELTGYGYRTQEQNLTDQAAVTTATGANAATAGAISAGSSILSGAGQVASKWYAYQTRQGQTGFPQVGGYY